MDEVAFELKASEKDRFQGGSVALLEGRTLDIGARLKSGRGKIVPKNEQELERLREIEVLREVKVAKKGSGRKPATASSATGKPAAVDTGAGTPPDDKDGGNA